MKATVRSIGSPDIDPESYAPEPGEPVYALLELSIGSQEGDGQDIFGLVVCTPAGLAREVEESGPMFGRHHLVIGTWQWPRIREFIVSAIESEDAPDWEQLAERIGRIAQWEFEDYRPAPGEPAG